MAMEQEEMSQNEKANRLLWPLAEPGGLSLLAAALVKAQARLRPAKRESENPFFHSKYADLASVWESCREALTENGLSVVQTTFFRDGQMFLRTLLLHVSGQSVSGEYLLKPTKDDPQGLGGAITYARRYALAAITGVVADDMDGEDAVLRPEPAAKKQEHKAPAAAKDADGSATVIERILEVETFNGKAKSSGKSYTKFTIVSESGEKFTTLNKDLAEIATAATESHDEMVISYSQNKYGKSLVDIKTAEIALDAQEA